MRATTRRISSVRARLESGVISLQVQHSLLLAALRIAKQVVFASELPMDEGIVDLQTDHGLKSFGSFLMEVQPALNHAEPQVEDGGQGMRGDAFPQDLHRVLQIAASQGARR